MPPSCFGLRSAEHRLPVTLSVTYGILSTIVIHAIHLFRREKTHHNNTKGDGKLCGNRLFFPQLPLFSYPLNPTFALLSTWSSMATDIEMRDSEEPPKVVLDALPYVDPVNEDYEQYALALIEDEMNKIKAPKSIPVPPVRFRTELMREEYGQRTCRSEPFQPIDFSSTVSPPKNNKNVEAWKEAVQKARLAYESERLRGILLELDKEGLSAAQWKQYNALLAASQEFSQKILSEQRETVDEINLRRQQSQQQSGQELRVLTTQYESLVQKLHQLKQAISELEQQVRNAKD